MKRLLVRLTVLGIVVGLGALAMVQVQRGPQSAHAAPPATTPIPRSPAVDPFAGPPQPFAPSDTARPLPTPQPTTPPSATIPSTRGPASPTTRYPHPTGGVQTTAGTEDLPLGGAAPPLELPSEPAMFPGGEPRALPAVGDTRTSDLRALPTSGETPASAAPTASATGAGRPGSRDLEGRQAPSLEIEKVVPAEVQVGKPATFEIRVRNIGGSTAHDVIVQDEIPQGVQVQATTPRAARGGRGELMWSLGTLEAGQETTIRMELLPTTEGEIGSVARVQFSAEASARVVCTRPQLKVEVTAPQEVRIGDTMSLTVRVTNTGTGQATGVVLSEHVPETAEHPAGTELEYEVGTLAPGESRDMNLALTAVRAGVSANLLVARGDGQLQAEQRTPITVTAADLKVAIDGPRKRLLDRPATYTMWVANPGTAPAEEVELVTYLPPGLQFVEANNQGVYDESTHAVHWLLEELPAGQRGSVTVATMPVESGEHTLRIVGTARGGLQAETREAISVEGVAALQFQVIDLADPVEVGGETTYEVRVSNQGSKDATNVQITALLPAEMKATGAEGPTRYETAGPQVRFEPLPRLAPGAETTYRITVQGTSPGDLRMRVQLRSDDITTPITKEESTRVYADE